MCLQISNLWWKWNELFPAAHAEQMRLSLDELQSKYDRLKADFEQTLQNNETLKDVVQRLRQGNKNREVRKNA